MNLIYHHQYCSSRKSRRRNEPLVFHGSSGEIRTDECRLGDHALPTLLRSLLTRLDDFEHFLLRNTPDLWERHTEFGSLFRPLILDSATQSLGIALIAAIQKVGRQRSVGGLCGLGGLDVAFLVGLDLFLHLDLLLAAFLLVEFGAQATEVLGVFAGGVAFAGGALASALFVVEALAVLLGEAFHVFVLRHGGRWGDSCVLSDEGMGGVGLVGWIEEGKKVSGLSLSFAEKQRRDGKNERAPKCLAVHQRQTVQTGRVRISHLFAERRCATSN